MGLNFFFYDKLYNFDLDAVFKPIEINSKNHIEHGNNYEIKTGLKSKIIHKGILVNFNTFHLKNILNKINVISPWLNKDKIKYRIGKIKIIDKINDSSIEDVYIIIPYFWQ